MAESIKGASINALNKSNQTPKSSMMAGFLMPIRNLSFKWGIKNLNCLTQLRKASGCTNKRDRAIALLKNLFRLIDEAINDAPDQLRKLNSSFVFGRTRITFIT